MSRILTGLLPVLPRGLVGRVARRYIAGDNAADAVELSARLRRGGFVTTIDMLGEDVTDMAAAMAAADDYGALMRLAADADIERNISIKLSQLGLRVDRGGAWEALETVLEVARELDFFVRIDMEDSTVTDHTLDFYRRARERWRRIGVVLQARLRRTLEDARDLARPGASFRLCKGIYPENERIAHTGFERIREAYLETLDALAANGAHVALATHDLPLIAKAEEAVALHGLDEGRFEFQALLGVPIGSALRRLRDSGHTVRLYVPFGADWYAYSLRRVKETPGMASAIAMGLLRRDRLDPAGEDGR